jgi:hypothetical protein
MKKLITLYRVLFKNELTLEEQRQAQYIKSINETTKHFNGIKMNDTLTGKIRSAKMDDFTPNSSTQKVLIQSSTERPKVFEITDGGEPKEIDLSKDLFAWLGMIRKEAKEVMNKIHYYEEEEKQYLEISSKEKHNKDLEKSRTFFREFGVLPSQQVDSVA